MALRRPNKSNFKVIRSELFQDYFFYQCVEKEDENSVIGQVVIQKKTDVITFEDYYEIIEWQTFFYDEWPIRLCLEAILGSCRPTDANIIRVKRDPLGFWESIGLEPIDKEMLEGEIN